MLFKEERIINNHGPLTLFKFCFHQTENVLMVLLGLVIDIFYVSLWINYGFIRLLRALFSYIVHRIATFSELGFVINTYGPLKMSSKRWTGDVAVSHFIFSWYGFKMMSLKQGRLILLNACWVDVSLLLTLWCWRVGLTHEEIIIAGVHMMLICTLWFD